VTKAPPNCSAPGQQSGAAAIPPVASGGGESRGNLLGPALGLPGSFCSLPGKSSNKAAQRQDTGSFQPSLTAALEARLWPDPLLSGPVWPDPPLQIGAGRNPAEEVAKAPVLQGFPQPWPACSRKESPRGATLAHSDCPSELPIQLLAAQNGETYSVATRHPCNRLFISQHPLPIAASHCAFPKTPGAQHCVTSERSNSHRTRCRNPFSSEGEHNCSPVHNCLAGSFFQRGYYKCIFW